MKNQKKGISLTILIITVIVMLILVSVITVSSVTVIRDAKKSAFVEDLTIIEDAVMAYYLTNNSLPIVSESTYSEGELVNISPAAYQSYLQQEINLNNDNEKDFYELDLALLQVSSTTRGGKLDDNESDIYVINESGTNVYYPLGVKISSEMYFSKTSRLIDINEINDLESPDESVITINNSTSSIKLVKQQKVWTNSLNVLVSTNKSEEESLRYIIAGVTEDAKIINEPISSTEPVTIEINLSNMTEGETNAFVSTSNVNKNLTVQKLNANQTVISESVLNISNLDIEVPNSGIEPTVTTNNYEDFNTISIAPLNDMGGSKIKEVRYLYTKKLNNQGDVLLLYSEQQILDMKTNGGFQIRDTGYLSKSGVIKVSKDIKEILAVVVDNAKNVSLVYTIEIPDSIMTGFANTPLLVQGMTPIKWDEDGNIVETTLSDPNWYNYANKQWANAKTQEGSMWVWIPRYEYKIPVPHIAESQTISVKFINKDTTVPSSGYIVHPAFVFGDVHLDGIWVAKFEASGSLGEIDRIDIKPDAKSITGISISEMFTVCREMEENPYYGWGSTGSGMDTHLIKNVEWGAVAYLSSSIYGKTGEVWKNPNNDYITGQAGTNANASATATTYSYNTTNGVNASTTGNVYGIYDMNGGASEYTAAYINNGDDNLGEYGLSLINALDKYKDVYTVIDDNSINNYNNASNKKGDAIYETSSNISMQDKLAWNKNAAYMPELNSPFFRRGGNFLLDGSGIFAFSSSGGEGGLRMGGYHGFRPVLAVASGI